MFNNVDILRCWYFKMFELLRSCSFKMFFFFLMLLLLRRTSFFGHLLSPVFQSIYTYYNYTYNTHTWKEPLIYTAISFLFRNTVYIFLSHAGIRTAEIESCNLWSKRSTSKPPRPDSFKMFETFKMLLL